MVEQGNLDEIVLALGKEITPEERKARAKQERKSNRFLEIVCILACDGGEFGTEIYFNNKGLSALGMSSRGFVGGIIVGGLYAVVHTLEHAMKHREEKPDESVFQLGKELIQYSGEGIKYAFTTEGSCVLAATTTEALAGFIGSSTGIVGNDPLSWESLLLRVASIYPTFVVGIRAMSYFTLKNKREAYRWISKSNALPDVYEALHDNYDGWRMGKDDRSMVLDVGEGMLVKESKVPFFERSKHSNRTHSLYKATSKIFPYLPEVKPRVVELMDQGFSEAGIEMFRSENVFAHDYA